MIISSLRRCNCSKGKIRSSSSRGKEIEWVVWTIKLEVDVCVSKATADAAAVIVREYICHESVSL